MKQLIDWNCHLLPLMGEWICAPSDAREALIRLNARTGIRRFCMMAELDCEHDSLPCFLIERDRAVRELRAVLPDGFRIIPGGYIRLRPGVSGIRNLSRLFLPQNGMLPVLLPWNGMTAEDAVEWNRILYHVTATPLIMEAEHFLTGYKREDAERLMQLKNVAYQFNYLSLADPKLRAAIQSIAGRGATVLFGTGVASPGAAAFYDFESAVAAASKSIGQDACERLMHTGIRNQFS